MNNKDFPPAFVTYGWCRSSYAVVWSLGQRGIDVHVGDASPLAMSRFSRYCKSFTKLPDFFVQPEEYFERVCEALKKTGAKVLLPSHEDVGIFCRYKNSLPSNVYTALPDWNSYSLAEDKFAILELAEKCGCPTPLAAKVTSLSELEDFAKSTDWPVVIKTRIGNSAKGVRVAHNRGELLEKFQKLIRIFDLSEDRWPIIQEFLPGEAVGVCVLYKHGRCIATFAERYLRCKEPGRFGTSTLRETYQNQELISQVLPIMDELKWHGVAHLDFVADKKGCFKVIEINPRPWGALALAVYSGVDFPYMWYLTAISGNTGDLAKAKTRNVRCKWVIGDCLAFAERIREKRVKEALEILFPQRNCYHDDFNFKDPMPLPFEALDYLVKFFKAGCSVNPVTGNMIR